MKNIVFSLLLLILLKPAISQGGRRQPRSRTPRRGSSGGGGGGKEPEGSSESIEIDELLSILENEGVGIIDENQRRSAISGLQEFKADGQRFSTPCCGNGTTWRHEQDFCPNFGIGSMCCIGSNCNSNSNGNTDCNRYKSILCIDDQKIKRPAYFTPNHRIRSWCGGYYCRTRWRIRGCWLQRWPFLGDFFCSISCGQLCPIFFWPWWISCSGGCWQMADVRDGKYNVAPFPDNDHCNFGPNYSRNLNAQKCIFCHGDRWGTLNYGDFWIKSEGNNCWDNCCEPQYCRRPTSPIRNIRRRANR